MDFSECFYSNLCAKVELLNLSKLTHEGVLTPQASLEHMWILDCFVPRDDESCFSYVGMWK